MAQIDPADAHVLVRLVYRSKAGPDEMSADPVATVLAILRYARKANERNAITGVLLFDGHVFLQVMEGPLGNVERLYEAIACDQRHREIELIDLSPITDRDYGDWTMGFVDASENRFPALQKFMAHVSDGSASRLPGLISESCVAVAPA